MKYFNHANARSVDEAISQLKDYKGKAVLIAGGTDLLGVLKTEILPDYPDSLINLKTIPSLDYIREDTEGLKIGAMTKLALIARSSIIHGNYDVLAKSAESVGTPEIRQMGTIGGNLCQDNRCWYYRYPHTMGGRILCFRKGKGPCHAIKGDNRYHAILGGKGCFAVCPSDIAIALTALDSKITIAGPDGKRIIPITDLYGIMGHILKTDEIIIEIQVPKLPDNVAQTFIKFRLRESVDFAVISIASVIIFEDGICKDSRIVLGAVAPTPFRAIDAEELIKGTHLDAKIVEEAAEEAVRSAKPLSRNAYKIKITKTLVKRVLLDSMGVMK
jgi:xanthine dehydrogenase YagS FAD-binding subunit